MIDFDDFYKKLRDGNRDKIKLAYEFGKKRHSGQTRHFSNDPYFIHPIRVALLLKNYSTDIIIAALLHDVVEDTPTTLEEIEKLFGNYVKTLVLGLTKIDNRNLFVILEDVARIHPEVILIKMADRIDNLCDNFDKMSDKTKARYFEETPKLIEFAKKYGITDLISELEYSFNRIVNGKTCN